MCMHSIKNKTKSPQQKSRTPLPPAKPTETKNTRACLGGKFFKLPRKPRTNHMHKSPMISLTAATSKIPFTPDYRVFLGFHHSIDQ